MADMLKNSVFFGITFTSSAILPTIDQSEAHAIIKFVWGSMPTDPPRETLPPLPCEPPQNYPSYAPVTVYISYSSTHNLGIIDRSYIPSG